MSVEPDRDMARAQAETSASRPAATRVLQIAPHIDPLWDRLTRKRPSDVFHSQAWIQVLADTYGFDLRANVLLDEADEPLAGFAFANIEDPSGERIAALPFCDYTDPLVDTPAQWRMLVDPVLNAGVPVSLRTLHNTVVHTDERFAQVNRAKWHGHDISALSADELWMQRLDSHRRNGIKRAERDGVSVVVRFDPEAASEFFALHLGIRKHKFKLLAQPAAFIHNIHERFVAHGQGAFLMAEHNGQTIGAMLVLHWRDTLYYKLSASVRSELRVRPNDLLQWRMMTYAKEAGLTRIDLGLSDWDQEGLIDFKRKYSTEEKTITFLKYQPAGYQPTPSQRESRALLGKLTDLLTEPDVPDATTERAGDLLYRYFA
jgi:CelD/BcsL family acetyltransferase involved in cellulose biosynthesis